MKKLSFLMLLIAFASPSNASFVDPKVNDYLFSEGFQSLQIAITQALQEAWINRRNVFNHYGVHLPSSLAWNPIRDFTLVSDSISVDLSKHPTLGNNPLDHSVVINIQGQLEATYTSLQHTGDSNPQIRWVELKTSGKILCNTGWTQSAINWFCIPGPNASFSYKEFDDNEGFLAPHYALESKAQSLFLLGFTDFDTEDEWMQWFYKWYERHFYQYSPNKKFFDTKAEDALRTWEETLPQPPVLVGGIVDCGHYTNIYKSQCEDNHHTVPVINKRIDKTLELGINTTLEFDSESFPLIYDNNRRSFSYNYTTLAEALQTTYPEVSNLSIPDASSENIKKLLDLIQNVPNSESRQPVTYTDTWRESENVYGKSLIPQIQFDLTWTDTQTCWPSESEVSEVPTKMQLCRREASFILTEQILEDLGQEDITIPLYLLNGLPENFSLPNEISQDLKPLINKEFATENEFLKAVEKQIDPLYPMFTSCIG